MKSRFRSIALLAVILFAACGLRADDVKPAPFTEVESLRIQNVNLQRVIVQREVDDFQKSLMSLKTDLEKARPGWTWNPEDGSWKKAEAAKPAPVSK